MKILDVPQSGHLGTFVSYKARYGQFRRAYTVPADPKSPAQLLRRARMGRVAARWRTLADIHLYRARLFGRMKDEGRRMKEAYPWESPQADLAEARRLIYKHGYLRRKEELKDAEQALLG